MKRFNEIFILKDFESDKVIDIFLTDNALGMRNCFAEAETESQDFSDMNIYERALELCEKLGIKYAIPQKVKEYQL